MITIKSNREIELLRVAGNIVHETRMYLIPFIKEGITTKELDTLAEDFIRSKGATPSFKGLNGFPGVYTRYVEDTLGEDGLLKLMEGIEDRSAYFKESIAYCEPGGEPIVFEWITKWKIDIKKSGTYGWSRDFVFIPEGEQKTLWCFPDEERFEFYSLGAYVQLAEYLEKSEK